MSSLILSWELFLTLGWFLLLDKIIINCKYILIFTLYIMAINKGRYEIKYQQGKICSFKLELIHFPFLHIKLPFCIACEQCWCVLASYIFSVVVITNRELTVWLLLVRTIHYTDIAAPECRATLWITGYSELGQVQFEFLTHVDWKDETF